MNDRGIEVRPLWYPCHLQPYLKKYQKYKIEHAEKIYKQLICLPSSYFLNSKDIQNINSGFNKIFSIIYILNKLFKINCFFLFREK